MLPIHLAMALYVPGVCLSLFCVLQDELDRLNTASENINKYEKAIGVSTLSA